MGRDIVWRIEVLALPELSDDADRAVMLVTDNAPAAVFARYLTTLMIERVAIAVVRRLAEHGDAAVVLDVAQLAVVGDVAPDEVASLGTPSRAFVPLAAGEEAMNGGVVDPERVERRVDGDDVGIGIGDRTRIGAKVARRIRDDARRVGSRGVGSGSRWSWLGQYGRRKRGNCG